MTIAPRIGHKAEAAAETKPTHLRLLHQGGACRGLTLGSLRMVMTLPCYTTNYFVKSLWDDDVESLLSLTLFMPSTLYFVSAMSL
jgi:hypothetical protein